MNVAAINTSRLRQKLARLMTGVGGRCGDSRRGCGVKIILAVIGVNGVISAVQRLAACSRPPLCFNSTLSAYPPPHEPGTCETAGAEPAVSRVLVLLVFAS